MGFPKLTNTVLEEKFWEHIRAQGFTSLRIQCGPDLPWASEYLSSHKDQIPPGLKVEVFGLSKNLMLEEMTLCKAVAGKSHQGLVISHAGTPYEAWLDDVHFLLIKFNQELGRSSMPGNLACL